MKQSTIEVRMSADAALVLFDWLARFNSSQARVFEDSAEERVLFDMEADLEKQLVPVLESDYDAALAGARDRVRYKP